jgi:hypothetical protein
VRRAGTITLVAGGFGVGKPVVPDVDRRMAIVVNNAHATYCDQPLPDVGEIAFDEVYSTKVKTISWMTRLVVSFIPQQRRGGPVIDNFSTADLRVLPESRTRFLAGGRSL